MNNSLQFAFLVYFTSTEGRYLRAVAHLHQVTGRLIYRGLDLGLRPYDPLCAPKLVSSHTPMRY